MSVLRKSVEAACGFARFLLVVFLLFRFVFSLRSRKRLTDASGSALEPPVVRHCERFGNRPVGHFAVEDVDGPGDRRQRLIGRLLLAWKNKSMPL